MDPILTAVLLVAGIGLISGTAIAILSKFMAIPVDEKAAAIEEILPQANCGSCGFSGCSGYAAALSSGKTSNTGLCNPGGQDVANKVASIMGLAASAVMPMTAVVRCRGGKNVAQTKYTYSGVPSCSLASQLFGGERPAVTAASASATASPSVPITPSRSAAVWPRSITSSAAPAANA